jgi:hypothetical protein
MVFEYKKNEAGQYVCHICGDVKDKQNTMHYHLQRHEGTLSYECKDCDQKFFQKYALDNHIKLVHAKKEATLKCPFAACTEVFHKKEYLRVHIARNHISETIKPWIIKKDDSKIYTCGCCKKECKSYPSILYHVMDHAKVSADVNLRDKLALI